VLRKIGGYLALVLAGVADGYPAKLNWLVCAGRRGDCVHRAFDAGDPHYAPQLHRLWTLFNTIQRGTTTIEQSLALCYFDQGEALENFGTQARSQRAESLRRIESSFALFHPDKGGSDYLAAQINLPKSLITRR